MRLILASHPDVAMFPGELPLWREIAPAYAPGDLSRADGRRLLRQLVDHPRMARARITLDGAALEADLARVPTVTLGLVVALALRQVARQTGKAGWGVKEPRSEFHADRIFAELPASRIVHMIRDPRDVIASQRAVWGARAQHLVSTVQDWRRSATLARQGSRAHGAAYVAVRYEDLVADPARVVAETCSALGLAYRPAMLDVAGQELWPAWEGRGRVAVPIAPRSVGRYRTDLRPGEIRYVEWRARGQMAAWRYETAATPGGRGRALRCLGEEAAWRALGRLGVWPLVSRALGRLPPGT
jgi:hypothetical protein